ncbi:MAG: hypothetical protein L0332_18320 [Chloroflexi bacterium]|nr:hypothetical protein [Chloroflexota bacterium]MCI0578035.1 hypothetical protein [Chloroflexota bacterium]MCI0644751.1 hypothetical protein [Chloroflexota bacterium]MCI0728656.1 hypothetical protein [Chloroflexota bacterium]
MKPLATLKRSLFLPAALTLLLVACAGLPAARPADFAIIYHSNGGMLPQGANIEASAAGGAYRLWDGRVEIGVAFQPTEAQLDALYAAVRDNRVERIQSYEEETYDRGGSSISVTAGGETVQVSDSGMSYVREEWQEEYSNILGALDSLVLPAGPEPPPASFQVVWDDTLLVEPGTLIVQVPLGQEFAGLTSAGYGAMAVTVYSHNPAGRYAITAQDWDGNTLATYTLDLATAGGVALSSQSGQLTLSPLGGR